METIAIIAFTKTGALLACRLRDALAAQGSRASVAVPERYAAELGVDAYETLDAWTSEAFEVADALLFVSATGIAVRAIAPFVRDKFVDPAVVSIDEAGRFAVPLLSGHVGGANDFARNVAALAGAQAVISTATDVNGAFAVDEWARKQELALLDRSVAKEVSAALLAGQPVGFASDFPVAGELPDGVTGDLSPCHGISISLDPAKQPFERTLRLVPRVATVGVGCKRNTSAQAIAALVDECLADARLAPEAVVALASIDLKADEEGLLEFARSRGWKTRFYTADELKAVPGTFTASAFVEQTTGVDNVSERAACAGGATLLQPRASRDGVTVALAIDHTVLEALAFPPQTDKTTQPG